MSEPTVSIIIPTYNRPQKLSRAIQAVLTQTYDDWELIVVNDHPDSDISHVIPNNQSIHYIHHDKNLGAPRARNNGIQASSGKYIALLDDDDAWKPQKLERQVKRFESLDDSFGIVYTGTDIVNGDEVIRTDLPEHEGWILTTLLRQNVIPSETPLIRRECFEAVGLFDPEFESVQDLDLWIRIAKHYKISVIVESLAITHIGHENRITTDPERKYQGHKRLLEKHRDTFESNPSVLAGRYRRLGLFAAQSGRGLEGCRYFFQALRRDPLDWPVLIYILMALTPNPLRKWLFDFRTRLIS